MKRIAEETEKAIQRISLLRKDHIRVINVLVVEDDDKDRELICEALKHKKGLAVTPCQTGEQCLEILKTDLDWQFALIDLNLPGMSGPEVMRELKTQIPGIYVAIVTGSANAQMLDEVRDLGYMGLIMKPLLPSDLEEAFKQHIN